MRQSIPKKNGDLIRYVRIRDLTRTAGFLIWLAFWLGGALSYNANHQTYPPHRLIIGWRLLLWMLAAAFIGGFLFRVWQSLFHRTRSGTVVDSLTSRGYTPSLDPKTEKKERYDFRTYTVVKLRTPKGRYCRVRFEQKDGFYPYYCTGTNVIRFHGLPYPVCTDHTRQDRYVCAACGRLQQNLQEPCGGCGHSLIDPKDL